MFQKWKMKKVHKDVFVNFVTNISHSSNTNYLKENHLTSIKNRIYSHLGSAS